MKLTKEEIKNLKDMLNILQSMEVQKLIIKVIVNALKEAENVKKHN